MDCLDFSVRRKHECVLVCVMFSSYVQPLYGQMQAVAV